jgi:hypothetical protein
MQSNPSSQLITMFDFTTMPLSFAVERDFSEVIDFSLE